MRRALLLVLAAVVVAAAGWSASSSQGALGALGSQVAAALEADARAEPPAADAADTGAAPRIEVLLGSSAAVVLKAGAPGAPTLVQREGALVAFALVVLAALLFLVGRRPTWVRTRSVGISPRCAPPLRLAPHRGPPAGLARLSGC